MAPPLEYSNKMVQVGGECLTKPNQDGPDKAETSNMRVQVFLRLLKK